MLETLTAKKMLEAFTELDHLLEQPVELLIGGGGAMLLAYHYPLATSDVDGIPRGISVSELDALAKKVAKKLDLPSDWLNPYFSTFSHTLPGDFRDRLVQVFSGRHLTGKALGKEDLLIMKCFAHRAKDVSHAKNLLKQKADVEFVEAHIEKLAEEQIPESEAALNFLHDLLDQTL